VEVIRTIDRDVALSKIRNSIIELESLIKGSVEPSKIERAFSSDGCGAVLIRLDEYWSNLYERFYKLQWISGHRNWESIHHRRDVVCELAELELPIRRLMCHCGVGVARHRAGTIGAIRISDEQLSEFGCNDSLDDTVGRPLAANRMEFHPSADWLVERESRSELREIAIPKPIAVGRGRDGQEIYGAPYADERTLLQLYREWCAASPEAKLGHGDKLNGNVYYGAFRGRQHIDIGRNVTVLFGAGEVLDHQGQPSDPAIYPCPRGGKLMVATPGDETLSILPSRLDGRAYVAVFFELVGPDRADRFEMICCKQLGWKPTSHCVQRVDDTNCSRGQVVMHVKLSEENVLRSWPRFDDSIGHEQASSRQYFAV
jgi:hypothetical protein